MRRPYWRDNTLYMFSLAVLVEFFMVFLPSSSWILLFLPYSPRAVIPMFVYFYRKEFMIHLLFISLATTGFMTASARLRRYLGFVVSIFVLIFLFLSLKTNPWKEEYNFPAPGAVEILLQSREGHILTFEKGSFFTDGKVMLISDAESIELARWYVKGFGIQLSSGRFIPGEKFFDYVVFRRAMNFMRRSLLSIFSSGLTSRLSGKFQGILAQRLSLWAILTYTILFGVAVSYLLSLQFSYQVCGTFSLILGMINFPFASNVVFKWLWGFVRNGRFSPFWVSLVIVSIGVVVLVIAVSIYYSVMRIWREKGTL